MCFSSLQAGQWLRWREGSWWDLWLQISCSHTQRGSDGWTEPNWICPRETMCLLRSGQQKLLASGVTRQTSRLPYHLKVTNLLPQDTKRYVLGYFTVLRSPWRVRFEAINRSKGTVVVVSRVKNRDSENLLEPSEAPKSCPNSSHFPDSSPGCSPEA